MPSKVLYLWTTLWRIRTKVDILNSNLLQSPINNATAIVEPQTNTSVVSTTKFTEQPTSKTEIILFLEMVRRNMKDNRNHTETEMFLEKPVSPRTSVFTRLGTSSLLTKINTVQDDGQKTMLSPLKRSIRNTQLTSIEQDTRVVKVKRLASDWPSPTFNIMMKSSDNNKSNVKMVNCFKNNFIDSADDNENHSQSTNNKYVLPCKNTGKKSFVHSVDPCKIILGCRFGANCTRPECQYSHYQSSLHP